MGCSDYLREYLEEEFSKLKDIIDNKKYSHDKCLNFISDHELEDTLSCNDINKVQNEFMKLAEKYLSKNHDGQFIIYRDWCVHICTIEFYKNSNNIS